MIAIYLLPVYVLVIYYLVRRSMRWFVACHGVASKTWFRVVHIALFVLLASTPAVVVLLPTGSTAKRVVKLISNYWMGIFLYIILFVAIADFIKIILRLLHKIPDKKNTTNRSVAITGVVVFACIVGMSVYGMVNAQIIRTKSYDVTVDKTCAAGEDLRVVLVADTHLGYSIGVPMVQQMVEKINALHPDVVCFAGDFFDNQYEALDDPEKLQELLRGIDSTYGVYACWGNHDIEEKILAGFTFHSDEPKLSDARMTQFVENSNITLLEDESTLVADAFYIAGRRDAEKPGSANGTRLTPTEMTQDMDKTLPIFMIDHEPRELSELADAGVDVDLCGHTHAGQVFPGNLTIHLMWENAYGYKRVDDMHNIVTSGVGVFGPFMRTFTASEVVLVNVHFAGDAA